MITAFTTVANPDLGRWSLRMQYFASGCPSILLLDSNRASQSWLRILFSSLSFSSTLPFIFLACRYSLPVVLLTAFCLISFAPTSSSSVLSSSLSLPSAIKLLAKQVCQTSTKNSPLISIYLCFTNFMATNWVRHARDQCTCCAYWPFVPCIHLSSGFKHFFCATTLVALNTSMRALRQTQTRSQKQSST